jgi:hypothetical protein
MWKPATLDVAVAVAVGLWLAGSASAQQPNDYGDAKSWLCRPGRPGGPGNKDACDVDQTTTVVAANGTFTRETWTADSNAPIDCFYVYPTVSTDPTPTSDMTADQAELNVVRQQFARFGSKCRRYAPIYRQVTLAGLRRLMGAGNGSVAFERGVQYDDVRDAWNYYIEHDNRGRGYVLVAHSQGSFILAELIRNKIDGKPVQTRMVSAILTARCTSNDHATYLEVTVHGDPSGPRTDDIIGDIGVNGRVLANWGLHLVDANLAMGNLVDIVGQQAKAWLARRRR